MAQLALIVTLAELGGIGGIPGLGAGQLPVFPGAPGHLPAPGGEHPSQGLPNFPDQGLPGGVPVPPDAINPPLPTLPPALDSQVIVAVHRPGQEWQVKAYPVGPSHGQPAPGPHG